MTKALITITLSALLLGCNATKNDPSTINLIPVPAKMKMEDGRFAFNTSTKFYVENTEQAEIAGQLASQLTSSAGLSPEIVVGKESESNAIIFETDSKIPTEGYKLDIETDKIKIKASTHAGFFYAIQSLRGLLPAAIESKVATEATWSVPCLEIEDQPRFGWRGYMLDPSGSFGGKQMVFDYIDRLSMYKFNRLHLHLVDVLGWRIQIDKYPRLTEIGGYRNMKGNKTESLQVQNPKDTTQYGGYYTKDDIREILAYAQKKYITIVPELEMPAHITSALAAYPEFSCTDGPFDFSVLEWPITEILCAGNEPTYQFLQDVIDEVIELFPSEYIHIGGDEATKTEWKRCPKCTKRMKDEGLKDEFELQSYFFKRIDKYIASKGRKMIGWNEIMEGGLAPGATVQTWTGFEDGVKAANEGNTVIMSPQSFVYLSQSQGDPGTPSGSVPLSRTYSFDPIHPDLTAEGAANVLGGEGCLWSGMGNAERVDRMTFPRLAALAETLWSEPTLKNWEYFSQRLQRDHFPRYEYLGIGYSKACYQVDIATVVENGTIKARLWNEAVGQPIYYTTDGSEPTAAATMYTEPITIDKSLTLKAITIVNGKPEGIALSRDFTIGLSTLKPIEFGVPYHEKYSGIGPSTLVNGFRGSSNWGDGEWLAWEASAMDATIDLGSEMPIKSVTIGSLQVLSGRILYPKSFEVLISTDGKEFSRAGFAKTEIGEKEHGIHDFRIDTDDKLGRYIKIVADSDGKFPVGHQYVDDSIWIFIDEIIVD